MAQEMDNYILGGKIMLSAAVVFTCCVSEVLSHFLSV